MFLGAAVMIAFAADSEDNAGLIIFPAMGGDGGALAQFRARTVGSHQQARPDRTAIGKRHVDTIAARYKIRNRKAPQIDPFARSALDQRVDQMTVLDHVRERFARFDMAGTSGTPGGWRPRVWNW